MRAVALKRAVERESRLQRDSGLVCKTCNRVNEEMDIKGPSANGAEIRAHLLKERMLEMHPKVRRECCEADSDLDILFADRGPSPSCRDDDVVSVCSVDIDRDSDFGYYNDSRDFLVVDSIPFPIHGDDGSDIQGSYPYIGG